MTPLIAVPCVALALAIPAASGCSSPPQQTGVRVGDETLKQFEAGVTTEAWLLAVLGSPSAEASVEGVSNTRVLRYALGEATGGLGAIMAGDGSKNTAVVYFIVTDGIVTRYWADRAIEHTITGRAVEDTSGVKE